MTQEKYWVKVLWKYNKNVVFNPLIKCENQVYNIYKNVVAFFGEKQYGKKIYEIMYYNHIRKLTVNSFEN